MQYVERVYLFLFPYIYHCLRLILTEACDNYDVHAHDGTRPLLGPHLRLS